MSRFRPKTHLILLCMQDHATPQEIIKLGYSKSTAYNYSHKAKKEIEEYYFNRKKLKELRLDSK